MTAPDLSPAELARVAAFDAAPEPAEVVEHREKVERVARALWEADHDRTAWEDATEDGPDKYRRLAAAAIAALPVSPAEEALRRVEALCAGAGPARYFWEPRTVTVDDVRAALTTPLAGQHTTDEETGRG